MLNDFEKLKTHDVFEEGLGGTSPEDKITRREVLKLGSFFLLGAPFVRGREFLQARDIKIGSERGSEVPSVTIHIMNSPHASAEDLPEFEKKIKDADIYIPEGLGWDDKVLAYMNLVSSGKMSVEDYIRKNRLSPTKDPFYYFMEAELRGIYNSQKPIFFIDVPADHELLKKLIESRMEMLSVNLNGDFHEILEDFKVAVKEYAAVQKEREDYMLVQLQELLEKIKKDLLFKASSQKEVKILMNLGANHTGLYHELVKKRASVSRSFSAMPYTFSTKGHLGEMMRRYFFNKEISDELAARSLAGIILDITMDYEFKWPSKNPHTRDLFLNKALSRIDIKEIQNAFDETQKSNSYNLLLFATIILRALDRKGISVPKSESELNEFLERK